MKLMINIINDGGIFYINGKRLGHDILSYEEIEALNKFIQEFKNSNNEE
ncbi:hypothetical protein [Chryseobacterium nematophagum]|nr:hypothetical protein [Chryseobacterium nematophagum]